MNKNASTFRLFVGIFSFARKFISNIFNYLYCSDTGESNDSNLLRELYRAGHIDETEYQNGCKRCSAGDFDPEELQLPM